MDSFETILREALKNKSKEEVAKEFTETLNRMEDSNTRRINRIATAKRNVTTASPYTPKHIGEVAILAFANSHPEWTVEDLNKFSESVTNCAKNCAEMLKAEPDKVVDVLLNELKFDDVIHNFASMW